MNTFFGNNRWLNRVVWFSTYWVSKIAYFKFFWISKYFCSPFYFSFIQKWEWNVHWNFCFNYVSLPVWCDTRHHRHKALLSLHSSPHESEAEKNTFARVRWHSKIHGLVQTTCLWSHCYDLWVLSVCQRNHVGSCLNKQSHSNSLTRFPPRHTKREKASRRFNRYKPSEKENSAFSPAFTEIPCVNGANICINSLITIAFFLARCNRPFVHKCKSRYILHVRWIRSDRSNGFQQMQTKCVSVALVFVRSGSRKFDVSYVHFARTQTATCWAVSYSWNWLWHFQKYLSLFNRPHSLRWDLFSHTWIIRLRFKRLMRIRTAAKNAIFGTDTIFFLFFVCLSSFLSYSMHEPNQTLIKKLSAPNVPWM